MDYSNSIGQIPSLYYNNNDGFKCFTSMTIPLFSVFPADDLEGWLGLTGLTGFDFNSSVEI